MPPVGLARAKRRPGSSEAGGRVGTLRAPTAPSGLGQPRLSVGVCTCSGLKCRTPTTNPPHVSVKSRLWLWGTVWSLTGWTVEANPVLGFLVGS